MTWRAKTFHRGGGDTPLDSVRHYLYWFAQDWKSWFRRSRYKFEIPFDSIEKATRGDENGHKAALVDHPFFIKGLDVMEWAQTCVTRGFATFDFIVDGSIEEIWGKDEPSMILRAKFSDKGVAALFKLTFGGKF